MKCNVMRQSATWLQQADLITGRSYFGLQQADLRPILFRVTAGRLGRSYANLISILFRVTASRSQTDLIPIISSYSRPILFRVTVGRSYFRTRRNACVTAGKTTMAAGKINYRFIAENVVEIGNNKFCFFIGMSSSHHPSQKL